MLRIAMAVLGCSLLACAGERESARAGEPEMAPQTIERTLKAHTRELMSLPGVIGTAQSVCEGRPCIKVLVVTNTPELERRIQAILEGYPVVIEETGRIQARPEERDSP